ncbi:MAG: hypothetical protein HYS17_02365 [Micavibrio aeruginosavorus]|uniref:Uncharacterized protein n=1 Tax=Micavibrio aeruginosavorus TaxID=349221 RepID=A0A7T5R398_9BACT|nr:MAG: hypothetical protein HYS17_02365 [Micavibrio aeruginosavorus]
MKLSDKTCKAVKSADRLDNPDIDTIIYTGTDDGDQDVVEFGLHSYIRPHHNFIRAADARIVCANDNDEMEYSYAV